MNRILSLFIAGLLLFSLCACKRPAEAETPAATEAPLTELTVQADKTPVLSPGAAEESRLSGLFQIDDEGTLYTSLVQAEGLVCLYDLLPGDVGFVSGFFITADGIYASIKQSDYSLEPAALYRFPGDGGEGQLLVEEVYPGGMFCLAGDGLFYLNYFEEYLYRLDIRTGETQCVLAQPTKLLGADGGFIYYTRDGGLYRNDSLMSSEVMLFEDNGIRRFFSDADSICVLTFDEAGAPVVELHEPDGTLRVQTALEEYTDSILRQGERIYVPQTDAGVVLVLDLDGTEL